MRSNGTGPSLSPTRRSDSLPSRGRSKDGDRRASGKRKRSEAPIPGAPTSPGSRASAAFNNLFADTVQGAKGAPTIDFAAHAAALGARSENVKTIPELEAALRRARAADRTYVVCIETDPNRTTEEGGWWWEVAVPEVSDRESVRKARVAYEDGKRQQKP